MVGTLHIIGGGMAGLAAAVEAAGTCKHIVLHESGNVCGGRARSYDDKHLGSYIDNGNHLFLSANKTIFRYLNLIGSVETLAGPKAPLFPFIDLREDVRWTLSLSQGKIPWWIFQPHRRVPDMRLSELRSLYKLFSATGQTTVTECLLSGSFSQRLLIPFSISVLNTPCETGSAALLGAVLRESLFRGGEACIPWFVSKGLSETFVTPALAYLRYMQAEVRLQSRITQLDVSKENFPYRRITALHTHHGHIPLTQDDQVILAVPAPIAKSLLGKHIPHLTVPTEFESILNVHFRLDTAPIPIGSLARCGFIGVIGGIAEWIFLRGHIISVTVSAANRFTCKNPDDLMHKIWHDVRCACDAALSHPLPLYPAAQRMIWEKRATFAATPAQNHLRPGQTTLLTNLALAGDWVSTGLPATVEGAMRSGVQAVEILGLKRPTLH
ncbi:MAG: FAD-dependent oxidoreductase [Acetobacter sp.]|nr:FAD-dependent oxidoreductase [Acetobacter sp.]MBQ5516343.1 FAD-dependent oxidoreductase [Acetobacter sp.]